MNSLDRPLVGVGVMIIKDGKILLGKRKGGTGAGEWGFPGGHLENGETCEEALAREIEEEVGVTVKNIRFLFVANVQRYLPKHYIHMGFTAQWVAGEPELREPEKCEGWDWYPLDTLPTEGGFMQDMTITAYTKGTAYFPCVL